MAHQESFYLINARVGWHALEIFGAAQGVALGDAPNGSLTLQPLPGNLQPLPGESGAMGGLSLPSALAVDGQGCIYLLKEDRLLRYDGCPEAPGCVPGFLPLAQPRQFNKASGLAISGGGDLYVADSGNRRVQVFALKGLPLRAVWGPFRVHVDENDCEGCIHAGGCYCLKPVSVVKTAVGPEDDCVTGSAVFPDGTWEPRDVAIAPRGPVYVADYANGLIHVFERSGRWRGAWDGTKLHPESLTEPPLPLEKPTHLAIAPDGNLYVLQEDLSYVVVLDAQGHFVRHLDTPMQVHKTAAAGFDVQGRLHLSDPLTGCVWVYDVQQHSTAICPAFKGCCTAMAFTPQSVLLVDALQGLVFSLEPDTAYTTEGTVLLGPLDSERYRCQWHRVALEGSLPLGTMVSVESFCAEAAFQPEQILTLPDGRWVVNAVYTRVGEEKWDCLVRSQPGRFLWMRLKLRGNGERTPRLDTLRVEYPRQSSLQHLPAVFREDPISADFLDRFVSIPDAIWEGFGEIIEHMDWYFDPAATPATSKRLGDIDFLTWLASWLGLALEAHWPEDKRRQLVAQAHQLYALRGTLAGLKLHIALYTGVEPQILEHFKLRRWLFLDQARLGSASVLWGREIVKRLQLDEYATIGEFQLQDTGDPVRDPFHVFAHQFTVYLPVNLKDELQRRTVDRIIEASKPAHVQAHARFMDPRFQIGRHSIIGINTVIGCYPSGVVLNDSPEPENGLGYGTVLSPSPDEYQPPSLRLGKRTRLGPHTRID